MKRKVLLVDDQRELLTVMSLNLEDMDYEVATADNGSKALEICRKEHPDIILIDAVMPDISGFELCRKIKESKKINTKVIIYTGNIDAVNSKEARLSGADDFAVKTIDYDNIFDKIQKVLQ